jgi:hypothetical protein
MLSFESMQAYHQMITFWSLNCRNNFVIVNSRQRLLWLMPSNCLTMVSKSAILKYRSTNGGICFFFILTFRIWINVDKASFHQYSDCLVKDSVAILCPLVLIHGEDMINHFYSVPHAFPTWSSPKCNSVQICRLSSFCNGKPFHTWTISFMTSPGAETLGNFT